MNILSTTAGPVLTIGFDPDCVECDGGGVVPDDYEREMVSCDCAGRNGDHAADLLYLLADLMGDSWQEALEVAANAIDWTA